MAAEHAARRPKGMPLDVACEPGGLAACAVRARHPSTKYPIVLTGEPEHRTCGDHPAKRDLQGAKLDAERELTSGPTRRPGMAREHAARRTKCTPPDVACDRRRISRRCGAAFFAHFLSLQKESESGVPGGDPPGSVYWQPKLSSSRRN